MSKIDYMGDFIGFTFNGTHSSDLNIVRVSDGSRYQENLLPPPKDNTIEISGADGAYFFNSTYGTRNFPISIAYENVGEADLIKIKRLYGDRKIHDLVFDEFPYKVYSAKTASSPQLMYICFDTETAGERVYKGEGSLDFVSFYPFARAPYKWLDSYGVRDPATGLHYDKNGVCVEEWAPSTGMKWNDMYDGVNKYDVFYNGVAYLYNPGDLPSHPNIIIAAAASTGTSQIVYQEGSTQRGIMVIDASKLSQTAPPFYRINSKIKLVEGGAYSGGVFTPNGQIFNNAIIAGDFFDIVPSSQNQTVRINTTSVLSGAGIQYDYLYY